MVATVTANKVILNRRTEVWAMTDRVAASFRSETVADAAAVLRNYGAAYLRKREKEKGREPDE